MPAARTAPRPIATAFALVFLLARPAVAQHGGRITGMVFDESGAGAAYALVTLVDADPQTERGRVLTDEVGRYSIHGVPPGRFRLLVARIGYESQTSPAFDMAADARVTRDVVLRTAPVVLDALLVSDGRGCYLVDELEAAAPEVAALWAEAVKGIEIKQAFLRSYRRTVDMRMETHQDNRLLRDSREVEERTMVVPDPDAQAAQADTASAEDARYGERGARSLTLSLPSEYVLTDPGMLRGYCVEEEVSRSGDGALGLSFRPVNPERPGITIEGTVFIEADDFRLRGLSYHYYVDDEFTGTGEWVYGNVRVPGDVLRLPVRGSLRILRIPPPIGIMMRSFDMLVTFDDYRNFEPLTAVGVAETGS